MVQVKRISLLCVLIELSEESNAALNLQVGSLNSELNNVLAQCIQSIKWEKHGKCVFC